MNQHLIAGEVNGHVIYYWQFAKYYLVKDDNGNTLFCDKDIKKVSAFCRNL